MARKRNYGTFTSKRKMALKKAQAASARKRKRRGMIAAASVGAIALGSGAYILGRRVNVNKAPDGTDISKQARKNARKRSTAPTKGVKKRNRRRGSTASPEARQIQVGDQMALFPISGSGTNVATETTKASGASTSGSRFDPNRYPSRPPLEQFMGGNVQKRDYLTEWENITAGQQNTIKSLLEHKGLKISKNGVVYDPQDAARGRRKKK